MGYKDPIVNIHYVCHMEPFTVAFVTNSNLNLKHWRRPVTRRSCNEQNMYIAYVWGLYACI